MVVIVGRIARSDLEIQSPMIKKLAPLLSSTQSFQNNTVIKPTWGKMFVLLANVFFLSMYPCVHICMCTTGVLGALRVWEKVWDPSDLELQTVVSCDVGSENLVLCKHSRTTVNYLSS